MIFFRNEKRNRDSNCWYLFFHSLTKNTFISIIYVKNHTNIICHSSIHSLTLNQPLVILKSYMELLGTSNNGLRHFGVIDFAKKKMLCDSHSQLKSNIIICRGCDLLLGYHSFVREREKHFLTMNALLNYKIYEGDDSFSSGGSTAEFVLLSCTGCSS